ncbi:exonuclease domain-containing protein [Yinghuangia seranimata]|uniref:exonuclease domain-containing protein n=1 Tax=Yinghuangia seranimata TaxID=408067 RepID=UPI00248C7CDF|nr:exonuclease domain-containing protein [Yinghuangia seranimata]MDI2126112.1 exonuclease domain-containing protein [Yinghuangia seranimata]
MDDEVFVVVDLETTGLSPETDRITEIAAVRLRGTDVLGEFATLVAPGVPVPAFITALTGISDAMVADAPPLRDVLPAFRDFARDAVLVAHNAPFDIGFLRAACAGCGEPWPHLVVVDTLALARALVSRGEVSDYKLATLARAFEAPAPSTHRAVADARATAHILRALIARLRRAGVHDLSGLLQCTGHPSEPEAV